MFSPNVVELSWGSPGSIDLVAIAVSEGAEQTDGKADPDIQDSSKLKIEMSLAGFKVRPTWQQANSNFSVVYRFEIGDDHHPMHIYAIQDRNTDAWSEDPEGLKLVDTKAAEECLRKWIFVGFKTHKKCVLVLNWQDMGGWVSMFIYSDQITLSINLLQGRD